MNPNFVLTDRLEVPFPNDQLKKIRVATRVVATYVVSYICSEHAHAPNQ